MNDSNGKKLLLSSVCQPFGEKYGDGFGVSYEGSHQLMWAQGIFRPRTTTTQWGIDFIAANLKIPTTTMHYPTMKRFIAEIEKGYDYIGIAFVSPTLHKMIPMVQAIRDHAPSSKIILGGYGTSLGDELTPYADYICRGEGVAFMRKLLGEPVDEPIVQPVVTQKQTLFSMPMLGRVGYVFAGLGCPNGCDFCATSHYFKRKHIRFLPDGLSILHAIQRLRGIYPEMVDFWINDEDFLLNKARGKGFLEAIRQSDLPPLSLSIFSSVKALSQFSAGELVEMGIDWVWVGYEGKRAGYSKMQGRPYRELFADLHQHGITVLSSMIIGFDYQTADIIQEEFDELMSLRPSMCQFIIYGAPHGTPSYARLEAEGRLLPEAYRDHSKQDGFSLAFKHPHIGPEEMSSIQRCLYRDEFERLGPSVFRVVDDMLAGYVNLSDHPSERVRAKARKYGDSAHRAMMLIPPSKKYVSSASANRLEGLMQRLAEKTGPMTQRERLMSKFVSAMQRYTSFKLSHDIGQQPKFTRRTFRMGMSTEDLLQAFNPVPDGNRAT
ncbi:MAG TPA: hypothetical protein VM425_09405 [Myxococcota bacterium]|nr:hypothetical protein [Myxococcota bacterium]